MYYNRGEKIAYEMGYRVDENGVLYSNEKVIKILKKPEKGYYRFKIKNNIGKRISVSVHRLVAYQKFGEKIYDNLVVRHLNGISTDNSYNNIEIGTYSDNAFDIPKEKRIEKSNKSNVKYKSEELKNILLFYNESKSYKKTMIMFNISSKGTLWHIINNRNY